MVLTQTQEFHSVRTVGNGATQYLYANYICLDASNAIDLTTLNTIKKKHNTTKKTRIQTLQGLLQRKVSLTLMSSNMSTTKEIIK